MSDRSLDQATFAEQLGQLRPYMLHLLRVRFGNHFFSLTDREDLVQDVCVKALERLAQFTGQSEQQFRAWVRQIVIHAAIDSVRRLQSHPSPQPLDEIIEPTEESIDLLQWEEENRDLLQAIEQLTQQEQTLVLAHFFQGKTLPQLAEEFQQNLNTLQKRKERAIYRLQDNLNEGGVVEEKSRKTHLDPSCLGWVSD